jgi:hypothetical protein
LALYSCGGFWRLLLGIPSLLLFLARRKLAEVELHAENDEQQIASVRKAYENISRIPRFS